MLTTQSDLPFSSPLAALVAELVVSDGAQLEDWSGRVVVDLRGRTTPAGLGDVAAPQDVGNIARLGHGILIRLRPDRWFYVALSQSEAARRFADQPDDLTRTDVTHAYGILHLSGARVPDLLAYVCALDFAERTFPDGHAAQTSLAKVPALIVRLDGEERAYIILVERSVTAYVWTVIADIFSSSG